MKLIKLIKPIKLRSKQFFDKRGFFQELFLKKKYFINIKFTAIAKSKKRVIRGMHFQLKNKQSKFIYVVEGKILDVAINLKKNSKNFGKKSYYILNSGDMLFIPKYYAHGYECLSETCKVLYHLDSYRDQKNESGLLYNDKKLKIKWKTKNPIISKRDKSHQSLNEFKKKIKGL